MDKYDALTPIQRGKLEGLLEAFWAEMSPKERYTLACRLERVPMHRDDWVTQVAYVTGPDVPSWKADSPCSRFDREKKRYDKEARTALWERFIESGRTKKRWYVLVQVGSDENRKSHLSYGLTTRAEALRVIQDFRMKLGFREKQGGWVSIYLADESEVESSKDQAITVWDNGYRHSESRL